MNCHRIQNLLSSYLDQELSADSRRLVRKHLFQCSSCARLYEELTQVKRTLGNLEPPSSPGDILQKVYFYRKGKLLEQTVFWGKRLVLTAVWILLFLLTSFLLFPGSAPPDLAGKTRGPDSPSLLEKGREEDLRPPVLPFLPGIPVSR